MVWVEGLPLATGTNTVMLTMTNAAGYPSMTNFTVVHSDDVNLTIDDVPLDQQDNGRVTVTGTIDSADFTVWVNGVMVTSLTDNQDGTWSWEADYVPLNSGGTATIQAVAIPNSVNGGQGDGMEPGVDNAVPGNPTTADRRAKETDPEQGWTRYTKTYHYDYDDAWAYEIYGTWVWEDYHHWMVRDYTDAQGLPGPVPARGKLVGVCKWGKTASGVDEDGIAYAWSESGTEGDYVFTNVSRVWAYITYSNYPGLTYTNGPVNMDPPPYEFWEERTPYFDGSAWEQTTGQLDQHERVQLALRTGGKRLPKWQNFFRAWGSATKYPSKDLNGNWVAQTVPPGEIQVLGKPLIGEGMTYPYGLTCKALPDNEEDDLTPVVQSPRYSFTLGVQKHALRLAHHCVIYGDTNRTDLGVGEEVWLSFWPGLVTNSAWTCTWSTTAGRVVPVFSTNTLFTAPSNAASATVTAALRDEKVSVGFGVVEPSGYAYAQVVGPPDYFDIGQAGAGMSLRVVMGPTNVSLYRVQVLEVPGGPTNVQGWFSIYGAPPHDAQHRAGQWYQLGCDNAWPGNDHASSDVYSRPWSGPGWSGGSFRWHIPVKWKIDGGQEHLLDGWNQDFTLLGDGTVTIRKFDHTVTRPITDNYGTAQ
jgi:hypothetical protein